MKHFSFLTLIAVALWVGLLGCAGPKQSSDTNLMETVQKRGHLLVGVKYDSPPFGMMDAHGDLKGFEIDLAHQLAKKIIGKADAVEFVQVNTATRIPTLNARQVDFVLATMTITPEREKVVSFTHPYYQAAQGILVKTASDIHMLDQLDYKAIAYVIGSTGEARLKTAIPTAQLLGFKTSTSAFSALETGRASAFSTDDAILNGFLHAHCGYRLLTQKLSKEPYGIAFRKEAQSQALQSAVQKALDELSQGGILTQLQKQWIQDAPPQNCNAQ